jgi:hypothetical protein
MVPMILADVSGVAIAVIGFVGAILGAVLGGSFVLRATRQGSESAERLAVEQREEDRRLSQLQWDRERKSDTYRSLVAMVIRYRQRFYLMDMKTGEVSEYAPQLPTDDEWLAVHSDVEMFASPEIQDMVQSFLNQKVNLSMTIAAGDQSGARPEAFDVREDVAKLCTAIIERAKLELAPPR